MTDAELLDEFEQLIVANATTKAWGAAVSARGERIAAIRTRLKFRLGLDAQQPPDLTDERARFERWVRDTGAYTDLTRFGDGYAKPLCDRGWRGWLAAIAPYTTRRDPDEGLPTAEDVRGILKPDTHSS